MDCEVLAKFTEPFFTTKASDKGTGLGMATVHGLITSLGGTLQAESAVGEGTTIRVSFERVEPEEVSADLEVPEETRGSGGKVLLVDDETMIVKLLSRELAARGYSVISATSPEEALDKVSGEENIAVAVLDYSMPSMTGVALAEELLEKQPGLRVLIVTGGGPLKEERLGEHIEEVIFKPVPAGRLASRIAAIGSRAAS
jgi:two-component system cell cycle sensor histidine kinase/response regulator CckA